MNIIVKQKEMKDCGICCVSSIIRYYKGYVPLYQLRQDAYLTKEGTTAYHLVNILKKYHFSAYGVKVEKTDLEKVLLPAIAHLHYENGLLHFVVVLKVNKKSVILMDPAKGKVEISKEKFLKDWTQVLILAIPKTTIPCLPKEKSIVKDLFGYLKQEKKFLVTLLIVSFLTTLLTLIFSGYFKIVLEHLMMFQNNHLFLFFSLFFVSLLMVKIILLYFRDKLKLLINKNIRQKFLSRFLSHLLKIPLSIFETYQKSEILTRVYEANQLENGISEILTILTLDILLSIGTLIFLINLNLQVAIFLIISMVLYLLSMIMQSKSFYQCILKQMDNETNWNITLADTLHLFKTGKNLNQTSFLLKRSKHGLDNYLSNEEKLKKKLLKLDLKKTILIELIFFISCTLGLYSVVSGNISIAVFVFTQMMISYFIEPIRKFIDVLPDFYLIKGILSKVNEFFYIPVEDCESSDDFLDGNIKLENISYSYDGYHKQLKQLNLEFQSGKHTLLIGNSGWGKSTICKLIQRQLSDFEGQIYIHDKNILDYSLGTIRKNITYLSQNELLLNGTLKENIIFGRTCDEKEFEYVCQICEIDAIVQNKPFLYETIISNDDENLSGGERQRILLARAILNNSSIYFLDECLCEVDIVMEKRILRKLCEYLKGKTVVYISHRPCKEFFDEVICL